MNTVTDLRTKYSGEPRTKGLDARSAAIRGAATAFAKPTHSTQLGTKHVAKAPGAAAAAAASAGGKARINPAKRPGLTNYSSSSTVLPRMSSAQSVARLDKSAAFANNEIAQRSHSNIAAAAAAAKHAPSRPVHPAFEEPVDENPPPGTVTDVRKWLQSLEEHTVEAIAPLSFHHISPDDNLQLGRNTEAAVGQVSLPKQPQPQPQQPQLHSPKPIRNFTSSQTVLSSEKTGSIGVEHPHAQNSSDNLKQVARTSPTTLVSLRHSTRAATLPSQTATAIPIESALGIELKTRPKPNFMKYRTDDSVPQLGKRKVSTNGSIDVTSNNASQSQVPATRMVPSQFRWQQSHSKYANHMINPDALANAMVASNLASRNPSPSRSSSSLPPKRNEKSHYRNPLSYFRHENPESRTPSPVKGMKHTLRKEQSSDEEAPPSHSHKVPKMFNLRKHPNKHHEGDRQRWRDSITERERKRYEGVWAANKGLFIKPLTAKERQFLLVAPATPVRTNCVLNLVVRDIWGRSRLPSHVLEEVWDLVDRGGTGMLEKEEFVVGLWLIDQRLKGRKLPTKVGESVWKSIQGTGLKIPKYK